MSFRKIELRNTNKPSAVPSWDKSGIGKLGILPIKYAGKVNSVEVDRQVFRAFMDAVKAEKEYAVDNLSDYPPVFIYRWPGEHSDPRKLVFGVCVYARHKPAQYYLILERLTAKLHFIIAKVLEDAQKATAITNHPQPDWSNIRQSIMPVRKPGHSPSSWGKGTHRGGSSAKPKGKDAPVSRAPAKAPSLEVRKAQRYSTHPWRRK